MNSDFDVGLAVARDFPNLMIAEIAVTGGQRGDWLLELGQVFAALREMGLPTLVEGLSARLASSALSLRNRTVFPELAVACPEGIG